MCHAIRRPANDPIARHCNDKEIRLMSPNLQGVIAIRQTSCRLSPHRCFDRERRLPCSNPSSANKRWIILGCAKRATAFNNARARRAVNSGSTDRSRIHDFRPGWWKTAVPHGAARKPPTIFRHQVLTIVIGNIAASNSLALPTVPALRRATIHGAPSPIGRTMIISPPACPVARHANTVHSSCGTPPGIWQSIDGAFIQNHHCRRGNPSSGNAAPDASEAPCHALAAHRIIDKKIFEINPGPPAKRGIIVEPKRKARRFPVPEGKIAIGPRRCAKQAFTDIPDRGRNFMAQAFIIRKLADVIKDDLFVARNRLSDRRVIATIPKCQGEIAFHTPADHVTHRLPKRMSRRQRNPMANRRQQETGAVMWTTPSSRCQKCGPRQASASFGRKNCIRENKLLPSGAPIRPQVPRSNTTPILAISAMLLPDQIPGASDSRQALLSPQGRDLKHRLKQRYTAIETDNEQPSSHQAAIATRISAARRREFETHQMKPS